MFSPENVTTPTAAAASAPRRSQPQTIPPQSRPKEIRPQIKVETEKPPSPKKRPDPSIAIREMQPPAIVSPFSSPPVKENKPRVRQQSNSEPELVPVVKKLDEKEFENVIKESQRTKVKIEKADKRPEQPSRSLNGIETDPTLVSNLLKESLAKPVPITVPTEKKSPVIEIKKEVIEPPIQHPQPPPPPTQPEPPQETESEHKHKKEKKKKDKHKHKDRDKSKEERKKHKKDKDKEKRKEEKDVPQQPTEPQDGTLRITIPRDKLSTSPGLKIKIPKERLAAPPPPPQTSGLKIKISKEVLETSRKRTAGPEAGPPSKIQRNGAKVGWNVPFRPPMVHAQPYYMVQPPPMYFNNYNSSYGSNYMDGYYYPPMFAPQPPQPQMQPPLPAMPPPPVPPPPPE